MNLLKSTTIKGEIFSEYAFLTFDLCFKNNEAEAVSAEYMFGLPKGALISDMKILTSEGKLIRTTITSLSHAEAIWSSDTAAAILRRTEADTYLLSLGSLGSGSCRVLINAYTPLCDTLTIPLALGCGGLEQSCAEAEIELLVRGENRKNSSPTHRIVCTAKNGGTLVSSGKIAADRDFCMTVSGEPKENSAIAARGITGGEMLCRIYPDADFFKATEHKYSRVLFMYDATGSLLYGAASAAREFLCAAAEAFDGEIAVAVAQREPKFLTDGFCSADEKTLENLTRELSELELGGSVCDMFEFVKPYIDGDTLPVLICGFELTDGKLAAATAERLLSGSGMCCVSFSAYSGGIAAELAALCGGFYKNIFGGDDIRSRAAVITENFSRGRGGDICAEAFGAESAVIGSADRENDGVTVFVRYSGNMPPANIVLRRGAQCRSYQLENISVYDSFAPIGLVHAEELFARLNAELAVCAPEQVQEIRRQMELVGVKYSALNSETALTAKLDGERPAAIRVVIPSTGCKPHAVFDGRASAFREGDATPVSAEYSEIMRVCIDMIIKSMRANGAICADGEINSETARQQTLICILALTSADIAKKYPVFTAAAKRFLGGYAYKNAEFTDNPDEAERMLKAIFGSSQSAHFDEVPDLLTAAKLVSLNKLPLKNSINLY